MESMAYAFLRRNAHLFIIPFLLLQKIMRMFCEFLEELGEKVTVQKVSKLDSEI